MDLSVIEKLYEVVAGRKENYEEGSYTCYLFEKGLDKICKKIGEESAETIIAAKNRNNEELTLEISDLIYHLIVLMNQAELPLEAVIDELEKRSQKIGNLKPTRQTDKNS
ncbi:MAG: phosphoribosyl-ATP diphosphatase [Clostridiales bacterium]|jgi:phosphoribosyl-ATP pyrophosphohydrolase|nr:phosphoribosyl-ATP diphosphatase [Clostridiales bacterium]